jgi:hypothetical protein
MPRSPSPRAQDWLGRDTARVGQVALADRMVNASVMRPAGLFSARSFPATFPDQSLYVRVLTTSFHSSSRFAFFAPSTTIHISAASVGPATFPGFCASRFLTPKSKATVAATRRTLGREPTPRLRVSISLFNSREGALFLSSQPPCLAVCSRFVPSRPSKGPDQKHARVATIRYSLATSRMRSSVRLGDSS